MPLEHLEAYWGALGAAWSLLESLGVLLGSSWGLLGVLLGCSWGALGSLLGDGLEYSWGALGTSWVFTARKEAKTRKRSKNNKHVAVAREWLTFLENCCCGQQTGGVPSPFGGPEASKSHFCLQNQWVLMVLTPPWAEGTGVGQGNGTVLGRS